MDPPGSGINSMDPPASGNEIKPEKLEEAKEAGPLFHCDLSDSELVYKIAQALLPGLSSACVDNTTGALLRSYASVAINIRRDMVAYLVQRSETFVAESVVLEGGTDGDVSDNPFDVISNFIDDFAASKRNFLSRVSGWLLSDRREDRIDEFLQQMEVNGFWLMGRRESVAQTLLKNVDIKNAFHCNMKFKESKELDEHISHCSFRSIICGNEGCDSRFSACHREEHESTCPSEIIQCEQKCPETIMRREMDKHCITVCTMKLVNCPLYQFGCHATIPQCNIDEHLMDNLQDHILNVLRTSHKGHSEDSLKKRLDEIEKISSLDNLASLRDARSLTNAVKNYESKLGPMEEIKVEPESNVNEGQLKENQGITSSSSSEDNLELSQNNEKVLASTITNPEPKDSQEKKDVVGSTVSTSLQEENPDKSPKEKKKHENSSPRKKENVVIESHVEIPKNVHNSMEEDKQSTSSSDNEIVESHTKIEKRSESSDESEKHEKLATKKYDKDKRHVLEDSLVNVNEHELDQDTKFQKSTTQALTPIDDFVEERSRSTSSSDKSTSPAKRDVMDGQSKKHEGMISSSSGKDNLEISHNIGKFLESTIMKPELNESSLEKDLVGSPASIKEIINEIVESPTKMEKLSESSKESEEHEKSPTKKYNQEDSPFKRNVVEDSRVNINEHELHEDEKFQKSPIQAPKPIDDFVEKQRRSTSSLDKSTSPANSDVMDRKSKKNGGKLSSSSSEDNLEIPQYIENVLESTIMKPEPKESPVKNDLVGSPTSIKEIINEIVKSPAKTEKLSESSDESEDHEKSRTKKYNQDDSPFERNVLGNSHVNINEHELDRDAKFQKSTTQALKPIDDFIEKRRRSTSSSDKSTSPIKMDVLDGQSKKKEGNISSSSSEDNLEIAHDIGKVLESTVTKPESKESLEKDLVGSPASVKELINEIVESPAKTEKLSDDSDESEDHENSPTKKYNQDDSPFERNVLGNSHVNINEHELDRDAKFQKFTTQALKPIDDFIEKRRRSTSSSDKSTSPIKMDVLDGQLTKNEGNVSSFSSEDNLEIAHDIGKLLESTVTKPEPKESLEKDLVGSPASIKELINEIVESPAKTEKDSESSDESEEHEKSTTKKYNQDDSPFKRNVHGNSHVNINEHELHDDSKFQKSATEAPKPIDNSIEKPRQSTSSSDKSTSPTKRDEMVSSLDNLTPLRDARPLKNERNTSSTSSEDNQELSLSIIRVLESTVTKPEPNESPVKEYLVGSPVSTKEIINEIVESPAKMEKDSESSNESEKHEKLPTKICHQTSSPIKRHVLEDSPLNINDHELNLNAKFQQCVTEAPEKVDDFIEKLKQSTTFSDRSTIPVKMDEMVFSLDNVTPIRDARTLTHEGTSSTSSEDNLELHHNIERVLDSTVTKHKPNESPVKEYLVDSPVSIKEITNEIVESPEKTKEDSESSDENEENEKSTTNRYDKGSSPVNMHVLEDSPVNININNHELDLNVKFQKCVTEAPEKVDDFIKKLKQSTSFSDKSTSLLNKGTRSSTSSEDNVELTRSTERLLESTHVKPEHKESPVKEYLARSPAFVEEIINEIVESPEKTEKDSESSDENEEHEKSPIKIYDQADSPVKRHVIEGSHVKINEHELDLDAKFQKCVTEAPEEVDDFIGKLKQFTSFADKSTSLMNEGTSLMNEGMTSSTSSENNLELTHSTERLLESTNMKSENKESPVKEYLVRSPVSIKEIINDIVESPGKTKKDSESSDKSEERVKSPRKIYDHVDSPVKINEHDLDLDAAKFQTYITDAPEEVDVCIEKLKQSTSSSNKSTLPVKMVKMDEMVSSVDNLTLLPDARSLTNLVGSPISIKEIINEIVESPTNTEKDSKSSNESEEHEKSPTRILDHADSDAPGKRHVLQDSPVNINDHELNIDVKFQKCITEAPEEVDDFIEKLKQSISSSDKYTSKVKMDEMISSIDNLTSLRDERSLTNEGTASSTSSEDNLKLPHNIERLLESTDTKAEANESPVKKYLMGSPVSIKEIINEMVESHAKTKKDSESSDESEEHVKSPRKIYDQTHSLVKRHVFEDSPVNINEQELDLDAAKFQKCVTEASKEVDDFIKKLNQSTSSSDKSTSIVKGDKMVKSTTPKSPTSSSDESSTPIMRDTIVKPPPLIRKISESSDESEEHEKLDTNKHDTEDSPLRRYELENDLVKMNKQEAHTEKHRESTSSSDKSTTPIKRDEIVGPPTHTKKLSESSDESEEHEESLITKYDQKDSPFKRHGLEDSIGNIYQHELNKDENIKEYVTETEKHVDLSAEKQRRSISSSDKSISPVKRGAIESPTHIGKFSKSSSDSSKSSSDSEEHETSHTKKYDQEDSSPRKDLLEDSLVKTIKLADSPIKSNMNESSSDESDKHEKSPTKNYDEDDSPFERHEVNDSPVKIDKKEDSPVKSNADESSSSEESKEHEKLPIKKSDQEHSPSKRYEVDDSIVKMIKLEDSPIKNNAHESLSDESDE